MKGKLLIEPGFEAGSLYCGSCICVNMDAPTYICYAFDVEVRYIKTTQGSWSCKRNQQCLDAEVKDDQD